MPNMSSRLTVWAWEISGVDIQLPTITLALQFGWVIALVFTSLMQGHQTRQSPPPHVGQVHTLYKLPNAGVSKPIIGEMAKRIWWSMYALEVESSLNCGRPSKSLQNPISPTSVHPQPRYLYWQPQLIRRWCMFQTMPRCWLPDDNVLGCWNPFGHSTYAYQLFDWDGQVFSNRA